MGSPSKKRRRCLEEDKPQKCQWKWVLEVFFSFTLLVSCTPAHLLALEYWDFICQVIYFYKLHILAEEGGEGWLRASVLIIMPADTWFPPGSS